MDQNPNYFPGYYTEGRKVNVETMDRMLLERCMAWILAKDDVTSEAAFREYIDVVIQLIELDGANASHRHDVQEQALSTINVLLNEQGRRHTMLGNQDMKMYMREKFFKGMLGRLFDRKFENSRQSPDPKIDKRRNELRDSFKTILDVDQSVFDQFAEGTENQPRAIPHVPDPESKEIVLPPSHIKIDFPDRRQGSIFYEKLCKEVRKNRWKFIVGFTSSGPSGTLEMYPKNLNKIRRQARPDDALRSTLQPIEDYLTANGYAQGATIKDDPRWVAIEWRLAS